MQDQGFTISIDELAELETSVAMHGSAKQADTAGNLCFTIAVALVTYASA